MNSGNVIEELRGRLKGRRIALVHDWLNGMRGGERVLSALCELLPEADVLTLFYEPGKVSPLIRARRVREPAWVRRIPATRRHYRKLLPILPKLVETLPTAEYDLTIATSHCVAKGATPPPGGIALGYIFTPMRYVWDHFEDYLSGRFLPDTGLRIFRKPLQKWDRRTARNLDSIAADSHHIAGKIERFWGRRSIVIYPPVDLEFYTPGERNEAPGDYFLLAGAMVPYKRFDRGIRAANRARVPLVVSGSGPERERLEALAGPTVSFVGHVTDTRLRDLYRGCRALIYPGVEDFGITALEAMACGRPVLALRQGGVTETVIEGETGAFFDFASAEALAELLTRFRPQDYKRERMRARAGEFSAERFRNEVAEWILKEASLRGW